jgi:hypothetical protein
MKKVPVWFCDKIVAYAKVDDADYELVIQYKWYAYVDRAVASIGRTRVYMHILIMGKAPAGFLWGHMDNDPLNNCRRNLQVITHSQNALMRQKSRREVAH